MTARPTAFASAGWPTIREAFAKAGYCISALGDYRFVEVWVRDADAYSGMKIYRERNYAAPGSPGYRENVRVDRQGEGQTPARHDAHSPCPATRLEQSPV